MDKYRLIIVEIKAIEDTKFSDFIYFVLDNQELIENIEYKGDNMYNILFKYPEKHKESHIEQINSLIKQSLGDKCEYFYINYLTNE